VLLVYVLCQTITYTLVGRFSDIFGRRWFFIGANTLALVGYVICGCAHSINMVIAGVSLYQEDLLGNKRANLTESRVL
jgi:MFS family permease